MRSYDMANMTRVDATMLLVGQIQNQQLSPKTIHSHTQGLLLSDMRKIP